MDKLNTKVYYLFHSGFAVEAAKHLMIFDYFRDFCPGREKRLSNGTVGLDDLRTGKDVFVFSSHGHGDHFNPVIFEWRRINSNIKYILSSDIEEGHDIGSASFISSGEELNFEGMAIKAYGSTDLGVSYLVKTDGLSIFHAGDLNWWYWWNDTPEEIEVMEDSFKNEIAKIKGEDIDIAFFPLDPRLRHNYSLGPEFFIRELKPIYFFPMHFGNKYGTTKTFADRMQPFPCKTFAISRRGQEFIL